MSERLSPAQRAALLAPRGAGSQAHAESRATLNALTRRGLATHLGNGWYRLTDDGARKRAAIERARRAECVELVEPHADAPELLDAWGVSTRGLHEWLDHNALVTESSAVYVTLPDRSIAVVDSVKLDRGDLVLGVRTMATIGVATP